MSTQTAFARATTTLPSTKPVLRIFQDAVRAAVGRVDQDGKTRIFKIAEALVKKAAEGDIACIREVADRLDGKAQVIGDDGAVQLSFVVRLPEQMTPDAWTATYNGRAERIAEHQTILDQDKAYNAQGRYGAIPDHVTANGVSVPQEQVIRAIVETGPIDGPRTQTVTDPEPAAMGCQDTAPQPPDAEPTLPGTPPVAPGAMDRT